MKSSHPDLIALISGTGVMCNSETGNQHLDATMGDDKRASSDMAKPGPDPSGWKSTHVRLPPEDMAEIDARAGEGNRADFIRKAVRLLLAASRELEGYRISGD